MSVSASSKIRMYRAASLFSYLIGGAAVGYGISNLVSFFRAREALIESYEAAASAMGPSPILEGLIASLWRDFGIIGLSAVLIGILVFLTGKLWQDIAEAAIELVRIDEKIEAVELNLETIESLRQWLDREIAERQSQS